MYPSVGISLRCILSHVPDLPSRSAHSSWPAPFPSSLPSLFHFTPSPDKTSVMSASGENSLRQYIWMIIVIEHFPLHSLLRSSQQCREGHSLLLLEVLSFLYGNWENKSSETERQVARWWLKREEEEQLRCQSRSPSILCHYPLLSLLASCTVAWVLFMWALLGIHRQVPYRHVTHMWHRKSLLLDLQQTPLNGSGLGSAIYDFISTQQDPWYCWARECFKSLWAMPTESVEICYFWPRPGIHQDTRIGVFISHSWGSAIWAFSSDAPAKEIQKQQDSPSSDGQ